MGSDDIDLAAEASRIGDAIIGTTKTSLGDKWDSLTDQDKKDIAYAARGLAEEEAKSIAGLEFDEERVKILSAAVQNWAMVGAIYVKQSFADALMEAADMAGKVLAVLGKSLLKGLTGIG